MTVPIVRDIREVEAIARDLRAAAPVPRILIDGRSGAGKTCLARLLAERLGAELIHLDSIYPGWSGLRAASDHVAEYLLPSSAAPPRWQRWDWVADRPAEWHTVDPERPWIIEGCGAMSRANHALADVGVWVEADAALRKQRALARDGEAYAPWWDMWAAQEEDFLASERPRDRADIVLTVAGIR